MVENINPTEDSAKKNTIAKVWMIFSIIGLVLTITIFGIWLGFWCLIIWLILWIIWLFSKPRGKAITAVVIPVIVFGLMILWWIFVINNIKTPANEFISWLQETSENPQYAALFTEENSDTLEKLIELKCWNVPADFSSQWIDTLLNNAEWNNVLQKFSFIIFGYAKTCVQDALDAYDENSIGNTTEETKIEEPSEEVILNEENSDIEQLIESIDNEITEDLNSIEEEAHIEEVLDILSAE